MQAEFDLQIAKVREWIAIKGRQYDKPNGHNFADTKPNPIGWVHDATKYLDEAYTLLDDKFHGKVIDDRNAEKLLMKTIHACQIAMSRLEQVGRTNATPDTITDQEQSPKYVTTSCDSFPSGHENGRPTWD